MAWKYHGTQEDDSTLKSQGTQNVLHRDNASLPKSWWEAVGSFDGPSWKYTGTQQSDTSWGSLRAQPSLKTRSFHFIHPKQYGAFPSRIVLPYPYSDTFSSDLRVSFVYIHDRKSGQQVGKEGQNGWVLQAVIARGKVRRTPRYGKPHFTMLSLHLNNSHAQKRGIAKNVLDAVRTAVQQVDMVAGDFNRAAW